MTTDEIAGILGKKPNAIYVGLHRAIKKLRTLLEPYSVGFRELSA